MGDQLSFWTVVIVSAALALVAIAALSGMWLEPLAPDVSL